MNTLMHALLLGVFLVAGGTTGCADLTRITMKDVPRIAPEELAPHLKDPDVTVIDIRIARSWEASSQKIKGACREDGGDFSTWKSKYAKDRTIVLYCA